jgi:hypothetical protein
MAFDMIPQRSEGSTNQFVRMEILQGTGEEKGRLFQNSSLFAVAGSTMTTGSPDCLRDVQVNLIYRTAVYED